MSTYFYKILPILLAITVIVEKAHAVDTKVDKTSTKVENESKNSGTKVENESKNSITQGLQCDNSDGWKSLDANHTTTDCKNGHCFGAWLTGKYCLIFDKLIRNQFYTERFSKTFDLKAKAKFIFFSVWLFVLVEGQGYEYILHTLHMSVSIQIDVWWSFVF